MDIQVTYTEEDLTDVFKCSARRVRDLRHMGVLQGTKTGKGYVYHHAEIQEVFEKWKGKTLPTKKKRAPL